MPSARIRRWWYGVNNWNIPSHPKEVANEKLAADIEDVSVRGEPALLAVIAERD